MLSTLVRSTPHFYPTTKVREADVDENNLRVSEMVIHDRLIDFFKSFKAGSHPMAIMVGVVGALSAFDSVTNSYDMPEEHRESTCMKLIAKIPMIAAIAFRTSLVVIDNKGSPCSLPAF